MARQVGDLWPYGSGTASLGAEQLNGMGGFTDEYRPFAHVHMNSGVFHGALGESGVLRFAQAISDGGGPINTFEVSLDGGLTYAALLTGSPTPIDLQTAYDNGNEIDVDFGGPGYHGVLVRELEDGAVSFVSSDTPKDAIGAYGIAVSGFTATPENVDSFAFTRMTSHGIHIQGSGYHLVPAAFRNADLFLGVEDYSNVAKIATSGGISMSTQDGGLSINTNDGSYIRQTDGISTTTMRSQASYSVTDGFISWGQLGVGHNWNVAISSDNNVITDYIGQSGQTAWMLGPYEGLGVSLSHELSVPAGSAYHPLPHSGQVNQMILEALEADTHTLQKAYAGGEQINIGIAGGNGPVHIYGGDERRTLHLHAEFDQIAPLTISGVYERYTYDGSPFEFGGLGDIFMFANSFMSDGRLQRVGSRANPSISQAASMGPAVLAWNCGSGFLPAAIASGVSQFINITAPELPDDTTGMEVAWHTAGQQFPDAFYHVATGDEFVTIMVPGFYMASYKVSLQKIDGNERSSVESALWLNGLEILGSTSSAYLRNTVDAFNTANGVCMFNAEPGDEVAVHVEKLTNLSDGVQINTRECTLVLQYICPPRGGISAA
jgi:hypothetical protein